MNPWMLLLPLTLGPFYSLTKELIKRTGFLSVVWLTWNDPVFGMRMNLTKHLWCGLMAFYQSISSDAGPASTP